MNEQGCGAHTLSDSIPSLVSIVGLTDLLGIGNVIVANPNWLGLYKEVYLVIALIYAVFAFGMSSTSYVLERRLKTE